MYRRQLEGGGFIGVGKGDMAWVEASLPKRRDQWESVPLDEAQAEISAMVEEACQFVRPTKRGMAVPHSDGGRRELVIHARDPKVVRLDLVREFNLTDATLIEPLLNGLRNMPQVGRTKAQTFRDWPAGGYTLVLGPKAWHMTLYDKHAETKEWAETPAPPGALRCELRLHQEQLRSRTAREAGGTVGRVADLEEHRLRRLHRQWFENVGCDRTLTTSADLVELVMATDWNEYTKITFLGWIHYRHLRPTTWSRPTERKYRQLADQLGVWIAGNESYVAEQGNPWPEGVTALRLDYDLGHEVVRTTDTGQQLKLVV